MLQEKEILGNNELKQKWEKPEIYLLRINETLGGTIGNGENKLTHKPKAS